MPPLIAVLLLGAGIAQCVVSAPAAPLSVTVDSIAGTVEVQRAGQSGWHPAKKGTSLFENDLVRTAATSAARLVWPNGFTAYVAQNTQILVNFHQASSKSLLSNHVTVFFGAAYFLLKAALTKVDPCDTKVFSPTCVVAIRGTSFSMHVDKADGATQVKVTNGVVLVRNIITNTGRFVSAGLAASVTMHEDPAGPSPMTTSDIQGLKKWLPPALVDAELLAHLAKAEQERAARASALENKLLILAFDCRADIEASWPQIGESTARFVQKAAATKTARCEVGAAAGEAPVAAGVRLGARYVLTGEILQFELAQRARITASADAYSESSSVAMTAHVYLIDVGENTILFSDEFSGEHKGKALTQVEIDKMRSSLFDPADKAFAATVVGRCVRDIAGRVAAALDGYVAPKK